MAVNNVSREMLQLAAQDQLRRQSSGLRYQILPLSLLMLALVLITGVAFFRSDYWLLGASFIAGGFLVVSSLLYIASKSLPARSRDVNRFANAKHIGTGTVSTAAGTVALFAVTGHLGAGMGSYAVFVAQLGFALVVMGAFWLALAARDLA